MEEGLSSTPMSGGSGNALTDLRDAILTAIKAGIAEKNRVYTPGASEVQSFYNGDHKYIFQPQEADLGLNVNLTGTAGEKKGRLPIFQMSDNVAANYLQIMSPYLLQGVIKRTAQSIKPFLPPPVFYGIDPQPLQIMKLQQMQTMPNGQAVAMQYWQQQMMAQQRMQLDGISLGQNFDISKFRSDMLERVLNYSAKELNYTAERKRVVEESLILGGGVWLTQLVQLLGGTKLVGSQYIPMNDIVWDPDAQRSKDAKWMAIQRRAPAWMLSAITGTPETDIRSMGTSSVANEYQSQLIQKAGYETANYNKSEDEVTYWMFWSRMGSGAKFKPANSRNPNLAQLDQIIGDYAFHIVSEGCDYPLNLNPSVFEAKSQIETINQFPPQVLARYGIQPMDPNQPLRKASSWQIPYYMEPDDPWPVTTVEHYLRNGSPYPIPPLEFALSYMKFMVWVISFIADKAYRSNRTFWGVAEGIRPELKKAIEDAEDEAIITLKLTDGQTLDQVLKMIDAPDMKKSLLEIYAFMKDRFEEKTGMSEVNQATMSRAMRSATEADILDEASKLRPQAMSKNVLDSDNHVARKEAIAIQMLMDEKDTLAALGPIGANAWKTVMMGITPEQMMRETEFDVVASHGRISDLQARMDQSNKMAQVVLPLMVQIAQMTGNFGPVSAILTEWAKANQIDPALVTVPDMPLPAMNPQVTGQGSQPRERTAA